MVASTIGTSGAGSTGEVPAWMRQAASKAYGGGGWGGVVVIDLQFFVGYPHFCWEDFIVI